MIIRRFVFILILFIQTFYIQCQQNKESIKASLIYYFISYVNWPNENEFTTYTIGVLSQNKLIYEELLQISKVKKVKEKLIEVIEIKNPEDFYNVHVLYVGPDYNGQVNEIYNSIYSKGILLITDNSTERLVTMINFIINPGESRIEYEANKQNLGANGFTYRNELLLYGGSQVDIKELLTEAENKLDFVLDSIKRLESQIREKEKELNEKNRTIDDLYISITKYQNEISNYQEELDRKNLEFREVSQLISVKQDLLQQKNQELLSQKKQQQAIVQEILDKKTDLENARLNLEMLKNETSLQQQKITDQARILSKQADRIQSQARNMLLVILLLAVTFIAVITLFHSYRLKKRLSLKLFDSNRKLLSNKNELEETIKKLNETQDQLIQSEKLASLGMLTAGIAHEINNPVNFINSGNDLLPEITSDLVTILDRKDPKSEEILKNLDLVYSSIHTGVERTTEIISSLRNYIRFDEDVFLYHNIVDSLHDAILILRNKHKDRIQIHETIEEIPLIECIPGKIYQVFVNLLSNAMDAIKNQGDIFIDIKKEDRISGILIIITDTGNGIKKEYISNIFDPFFTTKEVGKGTGLGLYIVYGIIKQHNGSIKAESEDGTGATFLIRLPVDHKS